VLEKVDTSKNVIQGEQAAVQPWPLRTAFHAPAPSPLLCTCCSNDPCPN
jgi:hypothetical protein